jgi:leucine-rich repeat kinase 1
LEPAAINTCPHSPDICPHNPDTSPHSPDICPRGPDICPQGPDTSPRSPYGKTWFPNNQKQGKIAKTGNARRQLCKPILSRALPRINLPSRLFSMTAMNTNN